MSESPSQTLPCSSNKNLTASTPPAKSPRVHQFLYRIETKAGVDKWNQTSVQWDPWYQNQPSISARILQTDGKVSELDPQTLTDVPAKNEQDDAFSSARSKRACCLRLPLA